MNNGIIESVINTPVTLTSNSSAISFQRDVIRSRSANCCNGFLSHKEGSPLYKLLKCGYYRVNFSAGVYSATAGTVALGLYEDGVLIPDTVRPVTLSAGYMATVGFEKIVKVCGNAKSTISIGSVPNVIVPSTGATTATITPTIYSATLNIEA